MTSERGPAGSWQHLVKWDGGAVALGPTLDGMPVSDLAAGQLLRDEYAGMVHYLPVTKTWHIWDGKCHRPDDCSRTEQLVWSFGERYGLAIERCRAAVAEQVAAAFVGTEASEPELRRAREAAWEPWKAAEKYAAGLQRKAGQSALRATLADLCGTAEAELAERNPRMLNCANGTVDLQTGELRPHNPADMITYCLGTEYEQEAAAPMMFSGLLHRMCGYDAETMWYLVKALGYGLLGENPEQVIFFINGPTKSGKSKVLYIVRQILGALAHESQAALITWNRQGRNARTENSIRGRRMVTITETSAFMHIDEGQLKRITGEDVISTDRHYATEELKTPVTWVIFVATNDMPSITNMDGAIQERVIVIPGGPTIPESERDARLAGRILAEESEGILAWLVGACVEYHRSGLAPPEAVRRETDRYRSQQNSVANFIAECCVMAPPGMFASIEMTDSWTRYCDWARTADGRLTKRQFYEQMAGQPGVTLNDNGGSVRRFEGLTWKETASFRW